MQIKGLQKTTLLDFPGKIACTVFLGGCNFRCPFCHNASIAIPEKSGYTIEMKDFLAFLDSRKGKIQGVCVSGGEPTLHPELPLLLSEIKNRGFSVKLDTNGTNPKMLGELIFSGLVDYVAMDIKNSQEKYCLTSGVEYNNCLDAVKQSATVLMLSGIDFEFRTTVVRELHEPQDFELIGKWLSGNEKYFLQTYRPDGDQIVGGFSSYSREETQNLLSIIKKYIPNAEIR